MTRRNVDARGQSEVIGTTLLIAVVVILVSLVSVVILSDIGGDREPLADLVISANGSHLEMRHAGGDSFDPEAVDVIVTSPNSSRRSSIDPANLTDENANGQFGPGDSLVVEHGLTADSAQVLVVHTPTNTVLADQRVTVRNPA